MGAIALHGSIHRGGVHQSGAMSCPCRWMLGEKALLCHACDVCDGGPWHDHVASLALSVSVHVCTSIPHVRPVDHPRGLLYLVRVPSPFFLTRPFPCRLKLKNYSGVFFRWLIIARRQHDERRDETDPAYCPCHVWQGRCGEKHRLHPDRPRMPSPRETGTSRDVGVGGGHHASNRTWTRSHEHPQVGILDVDLCGPSIPGLLNLNQEKVVQTASGWTPVTVPTEGGGGLHVMSIAFLLGRQDDAVVWRGPKKNGMGHTPPIPSG